jgi:hypothetical protein
MVKSFVAALSPGMQPNENRKRKRFRANAKKLFTAVNGFRIDVTFEMRKVLFRNVFIQLMFLAQDPVGFISKRKRGHEEKIAER